MKTKELIEKLNELDPTGEMEVVLWNSTNQTNLEMITRVLKMKGPYLEKVSDKKFIIHDKNSDLLCLEFQTLDEILTVNNPREFPEIVYETEEIKNIFEGVIELYKVQSTNLFW